MTGTSKSQPAPTTDRNPRVPRSCYSDRGRVRQRNEDACALPPAGADEGRLGTLLALADGTGGLPGGAEASREAVHYLQSIYYAATGAEHPGDRLRESVEAVNVLNRLSQRRREIERGYLTTLVAAVIQDDQIWIANVGDSRAYLFQAGTRTRTQLTEDHSNHVRLVKAGLVDEDDPDSAQRGVITRAIGLEDHCQVDLYRYEWKCGDRLVLCSDGLASLPAEEMVALVFSAAVPQAAGALVSRAVEIDGSDNCTAVVAAWECDEPTGDTQLTVPERDPTATIPSRPVDPGASPEETQRLAASPAAISKPARPVGSDPERAKSTAPRAGRPKRRASAGRQRASTDRRISIAWLLLGLSLGWLTAVLVLIGLYYL